MDLGSQIGPFHGQFAVLSVLFTLSMAELGEATVNRIKLEKSTCENEQHLKELLGSRNNKEIIDHLRDSIKPNEDFQVTKDQLKHIKIRRKRVSYNTPTLKYL